MTAFLEIHGELFADQDIGEIFSAQRTIQAMLNFEAALAGAESAAGVIPKKAVEPIAKACQAALYDLEEIGRQTTLAGNPAIPLVKMLTAKVAQTDPEAAQWVHWGATSQDVIDSGAAAQMHEASAIIVARLGAIIDALMRHTRDLRLLVVARTLMQQAIPIPFALKAAHWASGLVGLRRALLSALPSPIQFGGAAGSLSALGLRGADVAALLRAQRAGESRFPTHALRQAQARTASELGIVLGALGKFAGDVALMAQTEIGEASEPTAPGKGGSSAMPHKQNPMLATTILACARQAPGLVATMQASMLQEHERALSAWHAEWPVLPALFRLAGAATKAAATLAAGLVVHPERMAENLERTQGLVYSETLAVRAAESLGRTEAKSLLEEACRRAVAEKRHLFAVIRDDKRLAAVLPSDLSVESLAKDVQGATAAFIADLEGDLRAEQEWLAAPSGLKRS